MALVCVSDYEKKAAEILASDSLNYFQDAAGDKITLRLNRTAFDKWVEHKFSILMLHLNSIIYLQSFVIVNLFLIWIIRIRIRPRVLIDIAKRDLSCNILGINLDLPIAIAPTSYHKLAHPDGENATAKGILNYDQTVYEIKKI